MLAPPNPSWLAPKPASGSPYLALPFQAKPDGRVHLREVYLYLAREFIRRFSIGLLSRCRHLSAVAHAKEDDNAPRTTTLSLRGLLCRPWQSLCDCLVDI